MKPIIQIKANEVDASPLFAKYIQALTIVDGVDDASDSATLVLADPKGEIAIPSSGANLDIFMGYKKQLLIPMGKYTVDEISVSGPARVITIRARAADLKSAMKGKRTQAWEQVSIATLVSTIANRYKLVPRVADVFYNVIIDRVEQIEESDLNLLTRLAKERDAIAAPKSGYYLFVPKGAGKTQSGQSLPAINLSPSQVNAWQTTIADRDKYQSATAWYRDFESGQKVNIKVGAGQPVHRLKQNQGDIMRATAAARAALASINRGTGQLNLKMQGDPSIVAESPLSLTGFDAQADGAWVVKRAMHSFSSQGFVTNIQAETPDK